ncbi:MAG: Transcriptional regulatory protein rprY [Bacteroidota bacterium]|jgi:hypothetical protein
MNLTRIRPFIHWLLAVAAICPAFLYFSGSQPDADQINLALRKAADRMLRASGDSTSRIPAFERLQGNVWTVRIESGFSYKDWPSALQSSLDQHGIRNSYRVSVRRCLDNFIDLGYQQADLADSLPVPCSGREYPDGCHYLEVAFQENNTFPGACALILILLALLAALTPVRVRASDTRWMQLGNSRLDYAGQILMCGGKSQSLTFREAKLLQLFAENPDQLMEREFIINRIWADEGVLVGRSLDVFVSRLRKKLADDPTVAIVAVHGIGYKLEVRD